MAHDHKTAAAKAHADRRAELAKQNEETERRMNDARPTPTQEENDLAKLGALDIDKKEPDGSQAESITREVTAAPQSPASATRSGGRPA